MKKILFAFLLLHVSAMIMGQIHIIPEVGVEMLKTDNPYGAVGISPRVGVGIDYFFYKNSDGWAISSGLYFYQKKEVTSISLVQTSDINIYTMKAYEGLRDPNSVELRKVEFYQGKFHKEYLQLPVMVKYKHDINSNYSVALSVGGYAAYGVSGGGNYIKTIWGKDENRFRYGEKDVRSFPDGHRWELGYSMKLSLYAYKMVVNCGYDLNLLHWNIHKNEHLISFGVGYEF